MNSKIVCALVLLLISGFFKNANAELSPEVTLFQLQFNKNIFVSGEKIWFKNSIVAGHETEHQTILYADLCSEGQIINSCIVQRNNNHWQSDLLIPDSLSTGVYLFRAYTGNYNGKPEMVSRLVTVINRFGNNKTNESRKLEPGYMSFYNINVLPADLGSEIKLTTTKNRVAPNSSVVFTLNANPDKYISGVSLSVYKVPEENILSNAEVQPEKKVISSVADQVKIYNTLTLSGIVTNSQTNEPVVGEVVLFSVPDTVPQINYAVTDSKGEFIFNVDGYYGRQDVIIQTLSKDSVYQIKVYPNLLTPPLKIPFYVPSEVEQSEFVKMAVDRQLLAKAYTGESNEVVKKPQFKYPFYGQTDIVTIPSRYIDLVDFEEISKEILPLCRIRKEKNSASLRLYDPDKLSFLESPWVIVDGVPVFDVKLLFPLNSPAIEKIVTQKQIRCYGALYIEGALSVFTTKGGYTDMPLPVNAVRLFFDTFRYPQEFKKYKVEPNSALPDFRDVLIWEPMLDCQSATSSHTVSTSYEKGIYVAVAEGIGRDGEVQRTVLKFIVK